MKNIIISFIILCCALTFSCSKFLDVELPKDQLTADLVFRDDQLAKAAMSGVYRSLEERGFLSGSSFGAGAYMGCYADELISYQISTASMTLFYNNTLNPQSNVIKTLWNDTYNQIYAINRVITGLSLSDAVSAATKNRLLGEAYFLRAFLHFYLVQTFGNIPYITSVDYRANTVAQKLLPDQVMVFTEEDLAKAEELLPLQLSAGTRIRPTKMAVNALQARVFLFEKKWDQAITASTKVISQGSYIMETDLSKTFLKESRSSIWQFEPVMAGSNTKEGFLYTLLTAPPTQLSLTEDLVNSFLSTDQRKQKWIGSRSDVQQRIYYFASKYKQPSVTTTTVEHSIVLRVEELFLIRSEAYLGKQMLSEALVDLNKVRTRTGLAGFDSTDPIKISEEIMIERRHEFFTEYGHRFYDLKRLGQLDVTLSPVKSQWKPFNKNLPLPESELLLNPNLTPQNDGY